MRQRQPASSAGWLLAGVICAMGLPGCGGKGSDPYAEALACSTAHPCPNPPGAAVTPESATRQVGSGVTFVASERSGLPRVSFQWSRSNDGGKTYAVLPGATDPSYSITAVSLADDAVRFAVTLTNRDDGATAVAVARLGVAATPPRVFEDREFVSADWAASVLPAESSPAAASAPTHAEGQAVVGGNPGPYRSMSHVLPVRTVFRVLHASLPSVYDPSLQGAIRYLDYREDCINTHPYAVMQSNLLLRQGTRSYVTKLGYTCGPSTQWLSQATLTTLTGADFMLLDGPACPVGASCPDFAASAAPITFGYERSLFFARGSDPLSIVHGIDNWSVAVWR